MKFTTYHRCGLAITSALVFSTTACQSQQTAPDFSDPVPASASTTAPDRIQDAYWHGQFKRVNKEVAEADGAQLVFFGDSITLKWSMDAADGKVAWDKHFAKYRPINMGNSGDITPVMLYRLMQGNLDFPEGQAPRVAVLLCGTNNYGVMQSDGGKVKWDLGMKTSPREVADGVRAIAQAFRRKLPTTRVIILGILPVADQKKWVKCQETNRILAGYQYPKDSVVFLDLAKRFLNHEGTIQPELFKDGTHLTPQGYAVLADALAPQIDRLMKMEPAK